jgi:hypothetical protein
MHAFISCTAWMYSPAGHTTAMPSLPSAHPSSLATRSVALVSTPHADTHPALHAFGTQRSGDIVDASIRVECGSAPQVLDRDVAESIALFKTGHDRHRHTFLGVYRLTTRRSEGKPVYQVRLARFDFFTVLHKPNYLSDKTLPCRAVVDQYMSHSRVWCPILLDSGAFAPSHHVRSAPHTTC